MRNIVLKTIFTVVLFSSSLIGIAQDPLPGAPANPVPERGLPPGNPIDDAVLFLLIAAVGLGIYMVARNYKNRTVRS